MKQFRYALPQVAVHWVAALIILFLLVTGTFVLADMPNDAAKIGSLRIHLILAGLAGLLVVARIVMRMRLPSPPLATSGRMVRIAHMGLNLLVLVLVFSGAMLAWQSGVLEACSGTAPCPLTSSSTSRAGSTVSSPSWSSAWSACMSPPLCTTSWW